MTGRAAQRCEATSKAEMSETRSANLRPRAALSPMLGVLVVMRVSFVGLQLLSARRYLDATGTGLSPTERGE